MNISNLIFNKRLGSLQCCWLCDKPPDGMLTFEDHHIVPRHLGGTNGPLVYLCADCHTNVHKCANKLLKGKTYLPYTSEKQREKCLALAQVITHAELALRTNSVNKNYVFSGILDYATHEKLVALVKYLKPPKKSFSQEDVIKLAISELYQKYF